MTQPLNKNKWKKAQKHHMGKQLFLFLFLLLILYKYEVGTHFFEMKN